jgi:hypothetical protein
MVMVELQHAHNKSCRRLERLGGRLWVMFMRNSSLFLFPVNEEEIKFMACLYDIKRLMQYPSCHGQHPSSCPLLTLLHCHYH